MATENEINEHMEKAYHAAMRDGTVPAIVREAIKDVRNTVHEVFFGKSERGGESGAPLNPLFHDIIEARKSHGDEFGGYSGPSPGPLPSPGDIAGGGGTVFGPEHGVYGPEHGVYGPETGFRGNGVQALMTPGQIANDNVPRGGGYQQNQQGYQVVETMQTWREKIEQERNVNRPGNQDGNAGNGQSEREQGRVLPIEERERSRGR